MLAALAAVSTVLDAVSLLTPSSSASVSKTSTGFAPTTASASTTATPPASGGCAGGGKLSSDTLNDLFDLLDADGDGAISQSEFENALGAGGTNTAAADSVFAKMDKDGDGKVSSDEMASALNGARRGHGHHRHAGNTTSSGMASSSYNAIEQAIQRQTLAAATPTAASVSVSA